MRRSEGRGGPTRRGEQQSQQPSGQQSEQTWNASCSSLFSSSSSPLIPSRPKFTSLLFERRNSSWFTWSGSRSEARARGPNRSASEGTRVVRTVSIDLEGQFKRTKQLRNTTRKWMRVKVGRQGTPDRPTWKCLSEKEFVGFFSDNCRSVLASKSDSISFLCYNGER